MQLYVNTVINAKSELIGNIIKTTAKEQDADYSFQLGNIESLNSEINAYKKSCLELEKRASSLISDLAAQREIASAKINALEDEISNNTCNKCGKCMILQAKNNMENVF